MIKIENISAIPKEINGTQGIALPRIGTKNQSPSINHFQSQFKTI